MGGGAAAVIGWSLAALVATGGALAGVVVWLGDAAWVGGLISATAAAVLAASVTVPLLAWAVGRPAAVAAPAALACVGLRAGLMLAMAGLLILAGGSPTRPTLLLCVPYHLALLAAETAAAGRAMWAADFKADSKQDDHAEPDAANPDAPGRR